MKRLQILLIALLAASAALRAEVSFSVSAPSRVAVGSKFPVTFVLKNGEASSSSLKVPQINGCTLIYGPSTSTSQSYQIYNGQATSSSTCEYTYYYRADKEGKYTIGAASITVDGKKLTTRPVTLTITPPADNAPSQPGHNAQVSVDDIATQRAGRPIEAKDVFVRISTGKSTAYEQEAIECTIKLYTKYSISEFIPVTQPTFNGFLVEDLPIQASLNARETLNGQEYLTALIKKCILFPQKSGKLTIMSGTYDLTVIQYDQVNMGFYSVAQPQARKIKINSNSASVNVLPLPQPQPAGFTGAVGNFTLDTRLSTSTFRTNDPATLTYTVKGTGNIKVLKDPEIDFPTEFEQYSPQHDVDAKVVGNNVSGSSTTSFTFVPKEVGNYRIGVPDLVYFDPTKKEYVTVAGKSYDIKVVKGVTSMTTEQKDVTAKNTDILFIKLGDKKLSKNYNYVLDDVTYWMLFVILLAVLAGALFYRRRMANQAADISGLKFSKASKVAKKRMQLAHKYMNSNDSEKFYEETLKAMWGYLSDKLGIPGAKLLRPTIEQQLEENSVPEDVTASIINVLDTCEMARYTPSDNPSQIASVYDQATDAIKALERVKISRKQK